MKKDNQISVLQAPLTAEGFAPEESKTLLDQFVDFFKQAEEWKKKAQGLVITDVSQVEEMKTARAARLALKEIRVNTEKRRKDLKERSLREGRAIDGIANVIKAEIVPIEEYLEGQEKFAENKERERLEQIFRARTVALSAFVLNTGMYNLRDMDDDSFAALLKTEEANYHARIAAEKAETARLEKEARARAKQEEKEKTEQARKLKEAQDAARDEQEKRVKAEAAAKETSDALATQQKAEKEKEEARIAEEKRIENVRIKAEEDAALAPDKVKLEALLDKILEFNVPVVKSKKAQRIAQMVRGELDVLSDRVREGIAAL